MSEIVLKVDDIYKRFGGVNAVAGVSFELVEGQILGLIGPNGAGKTTIFNMISGIYRTDQGRITVSGHDITNMHPSRIARLGIARTFQVPRTFDDMTLEENLLVPAVRLPISLGEASSRAVQLLETIGLHHKRHQNASELTGGERQLLQFTRAIVTAPKLLILDEPFAGASPDVIDLMMSRIRSLAEAGTACLVISHDIVSLPRLCEEVIVLVDGMVLAEGSFDLMREDLRVVEAYLGG